MNTPIIIFVRKERLLGASGKRQRLKEVFYYTHKKPPLPAPIIKLLQPIYKRLGSSTLYEYKNNSIYYHIEYEASLSSTWRELKAVNALVLSSLVSKLEGHRVKWFTDNQRIVRAGSRRNHLQLTGLNVFKTCFKFGIRLDMEWIPRSLNKQADYVSRIHDFQSTLR